MKYKKPKYSNYVIKNIRQKKYYICKRERSIPKRKTASNRNSL